MVSCFHLNRVDALLTKVPPEIVKGRAGVLTLNVAQSELNASSDAGSHPWVEHLLSMSFVMPCAFVFPSRLGAPSDPR